MSSFRDGTVNILGITNPGVYIDQILPTPFVTGVTTNIEAIAGVGSWGPVGAVQYFNTPTDCNGIYGPPQIREYDLASYVQIGNQEGGEIGYGAVRVTDGTDTAATAPIQNTAGRATAKYTGSLGNNITLSFQNTAAIGAYAAVVNFPGRLPERFDNIFKALLSFAIVPGTGYTSVPSIKLAGDQVKGGKLATAKASLAMVSSTLTNPGTGYVVGETVQFGNGISITVASLNANGAIATYNVANAGSITSGSVPSTVGNQTSTSGTGTGAVLAPVFGLGPVNFTSGNGYIDQMTATVIGGGGNGGTYTPITSFWAALADAINNGTTQRGASAYVVFTAGTSTAAPAINIGTTLSGGTDGAAGVTDEMMIGSDIVPRSGMYALRGCKCDSFTLCDVSDPSLWGVQVTFGISEAMLPVVAAESGTTIEETIAMRISQGIDDTSLWVLCGDWPTTYDTTNQQKRLTSPCATALGLLGNLSPEQSPINKRLRSVSATESSSTGILIPSADESQAQTGGVDLIGKSSDLNQDFFSFLTGRNASSNTAANGIEYTRLTNFLIRSLEGAATRSIVGLLQSTQVQDPTRDKASAILNSFFQDLVNTASGSGGYGMIDSFAVQCDLNNNPPNLQVLGLLFAYCQVRYLNVVRYFVIKLNAGGNVTVTVQDTVPNASDYAS